RRPLWRAGHALRLAAGHGDELPWRSGHLPQRHRLYVADRASHRRGAARVPADAWRDRRARLAPGAPGRGRRDADHPGVDLGRGEAQEAAERPPILPGFAVAFLVLVAINSLLPVPSFVQDAGNAASRFCLVAAIAALGVKTRIGEIIDIGWKPVLLMLMETIF